MLYLRGVAPIGPVRVRLAQSANVLFFATDAGWAYDGVAPPPMLDGRPMNYEILSTAKPAQSADAQRSWSSALSTCQTALWYDTWGSWLDLAGDAIEPQLHLCGVRNSSKSVSMAPCPFSVMHLHSDDSLMEDELRVLKFTTNYHR
eukprot:PhM_4_TR11687/c3_g3_i1/m.76275